MKRTIKISAFLILVAGAVAAGWVIRELYRPYQGHSPNLILVIEAGTQAPAVAQILAERGVLAEPTPFLLRYFISRSRRRLKAGEYLFDRPLRPIDVYQKLVRGDVYLHTVLVPEGTDRFDMADIFRRDLNLNSDEFIRATQHTSLVRDFDPQATTLEGYLFPDTYRFPRGVSAATVVATMVARFRHVGEAEITPDLQKSGATLHDVMTLASLVEKETPNPEERPEVAGVFTRRLEKEMPLACDPTVVYAARLDGRMLGRPLPPIKRSDLNFDSPYNTYLHTGLPPGPIASPGEASIRAALAPAPGDALYFVSNNHGGHFFARTLAEHERNVARYRRELAEIHASSPPEIKTPERAPAEQSGGRSGAENKLKSRAPHQKTTHPRIRRETSARTSGRE